MARLVNRICSDTKLAPTQRDRLAHNYAGRVALLLREAIDTDPKLAETIKVDAEIQKLASRPEFRELMSIVLKLGR